MRRQPRNVQCVGLVIALLALTARNLVLHVHRQHETRNGQVHRKLVLHISTRLYIII